MDKYIPKAKCKNHSRTEPIWMTRKLLKIIKKKHKLYKRYLQTDNARTYIKYIDIRNKCNKYIKNTKKNFERSIAKECKKNPKKFWKYVQEKTKSNTGVSAIKKEDGSFALNDRDKADTLNSYFSTVFTIEDTCNIPILDKCSKSNGFSLQDMRVTPDAVMKKLKELDSSKAQGPDQIPPKVLKELSNELAAPLSKVFNMSLEKGQVPQDWKVAEVVAIFKKGSRSETGNYRPVSLTCIVCKVLESLIRDEIVRFFTENQLYTNCQHGFRKKRSCTTQLLEVMEDITKLLDEKNSVDIIYLDFRKAFDTVPHERLLVKLEAYGISGKIVSWIREFLVNRQQVVRVGDELSKKIEVKSGIPQGSILGPILFTIFINDLPDNVSSYCKVFADDTKIYNSHDKSDHLQQDLISMQEWTNAWNLHFNINKCKVLHVGKNNKNSDYTLSTENGENIQITVTQEERDLGVVFDQALSFDTHIHNSVNKANKMLGLIKRTFCYLDKDTFCKLYKALVRPHLEYANTVWYPMLKRQSIVIERVQRRATKLVKKCSKLSYAERLNYLGLHSLYGRRVRGDLIQTYKIFNNIDDLNWFKFFTNTLLTTTRNSDGKIFVQHCFTKLRKHCFSNRIVNHWNNLSLSLKKAQNINQFKNQLDSIPKFRDIFYYFDE